MESNLFSLIGSEFKFFGERAALLRAAEEEPHRVKITDDQFPQGVRQVEFQLCGEKYTLVDHIKEGVVIQG